LAEAPPLTRGEALRRMSEIERMVFSFLVRLRPLSLLQRIWSLPQKSEPWKWARMGRITGSSTGAAVGQQRKTRVKKVAYAAVYLKFKGNAATIWGSGKEVYAAKCYANDLQRLVTECFRAQRRSGAIQATADSPDGLHFVFRNQKIAVPDIDLDPVVEIRHYGLLVDPWNHWRGVSPDGVIFINGIACGVLEVKCSFGKKYSLYTNVRPYYYNQLQCELYIGNRYWPTIRWLDFVVWSPQHFTVDTYVFDVDYFYSWYLPRELKYYFRLYLPTLAERVHYRAQQISGTRFPAKPDIRKAMLQLLVLPSLAPPPPPAPVAESRESRSAGDDPAFEAALAAMDMPDPPPGSSAPAEPAVGAPTDPPPTLSAPAEPPTGRAPSDPLARADDTTIPIRTEGTTPAP
jgi:hypothetical protein